MSDSTDSLARPARSRRAARTTCQLFLKLLFGGALHRDNQGGERRAAVWRRGAEALGGGVCGSNDGEQYRGPRGGVMVSRGWRSRNVPARCAYPPRPRARAPRSRLSTTPWVRTPRVRPRGDKTVKGARLARRTVRWGYPEEKWWLTAAGLVAGNGVPVPAEALVELATLRGPPGRAIALPLACSSMSGRHAQQPRRAPPPPPSLPYKVDTSRPSLRTNWTRLVHMPPRPHRAARVPAGDAGRVGRGALLIARAPGVQVPAWQPGLGPARAPRGRQDRRWRRGRQGRRGRGRQGRGRGRRASEGWGHVAAAARAGGRGGRGRRGRRGGRGGRRGAQGQG